jgi:hypothetical protein
MISKYIAVSIHEDDKGNPLKVFENKRGEE